MKIPSHLCLRWLAGVALLSLSLVSARATAYNWTNQVPPANGNWSATGNWSLNTAPTSAATATNRFFSGLVSTNAAPGTTTVNSTNDIANPLFINSLELSGVGGGAGKTRTPLVVNLYGSQLSLTNNGAASPTLVCSASVPAGGSNLTYNVFTPIDINTNTLNVTSASTGTKFTLSGAISGSGGLVKSSASLLILAASNTFTGSILINNGELAVTADAGGSIASAASVTVTNTGQLQFTATSKVTNNLPLTLTGTGSAGVDHAGNGAVCVTGNSGDLTMAGPITLAPVTTGDVVIIGGYGVSSFVRLNGTISGAGSLTMRAQGAASVHSGNFYLNNNFAYTGNTALTPSAANCIATVGVDNALPTNTVVTFNQYKTGVQTNFSQLILNGHTQMLGGLISTLNPVPLVNCTNRITGGNATLSTLIISNAVTTYNFTNLLGGFSANDNNLQLVKLGAGVLNLYFPNTYTGDTTVSGGTLGVSTVQTGGGNFTVSDGAVLNLFRDATVTNMAMSTLNLGSSAGTTLAFTLPNGLTPTSTAVPQVVAAGTLNLTGLNTVQISGAHFAPGTYRLIAYTSETGGGSISTTPIVPPGMVATVVDTGSSIDLNVTAAPSYLLWQGYLGNNWDTSTPNWTNASLLATAAFTQGDIVTLDDSALTGNVSLVGTLQSTAVTFSNSTVAYTLSGSGSLAGPGTLTLAGASTVTVTTTNTYTGGTTINAGTLQLGDGTAANGSVAGNIVNKGALVVANPGAQIMANNISGTGSLSKLAAGTLTVSGANTYTGPTVVSAGTLQLGATATLPGNSSVTLNSTLDLNTFSQQINNLTGSGIVDTVAGGTPTLTLTNAGADEFDGVIQNTAGTLSVVKYGVGTLILTNVQTYTGSTTINGVGMLQIGGAGQLGGGNYAGNIVDNSAFNFGSSATQLLSGVISGTGTLTLSGSGTLTLSGANTYSGATTISNNGTLFLSGNRTATAGVINANGGVLNIQNGSFSLGGSSFFVGAASSGTNATVNQTGGSLSFTSGGQLLVGNGGGAAGVTNIYNLSGGTLTGATNNARGVMLGVNGGAAGNAPMEIFNLSGSGTLNMTGATLQLGRSDAVANNINAQFNQTGGTATFGFLNVGGISTANNINAALTLTGGTFSTTNFNLLAASTNCVATITLGGTADVTLPAFPTARGVGSTATVTFDGGVLRPYAASTAYLQGLDSATLTTNGLNFNVASGNDISVAQALQNAASQAGVLTKAGAGTLTLSGTSTYTGMTTVSNGTLQINGSIAAGAAVKTGATLNGSGSIAGATTVEAGATLQPGFGGTDTSALTINSNLSIAGTAILNLNLANARTNSGVIGLNTLTYGGTLTVSNAGPALAAGNTFTLFSAANYIGNFSATNLPTLANGLFWIWNPTNGTLAVAAQTLPATGTNLTLNVSGNQMTLAWPANYTGWLLESNAVDLANSNAWYVVPGSTTTNQVIINLDPSQSNVFYRMAHP